MHARGSQRAACESYRACGNPPVLLSTRVAEVVLEVEEELVLVVLMVVSIGVVVLELVLVLVSIVVVVDVIPVVVSLLVFFIFMPLELTTSNWSRATSFVRKNKIRVPLENFMVARQ